MAVLIEGVEILKNCGDCPCAHIFDSFTCKAAKRSFDKYPFESREDWCPLIEVPEPHGRLIDVDKVLDGLAHNLGIRSLDYLTPSERAIVSWFRDAPTIIPASEEG